jgi:hypothetical protein
LALQILEVLDYLLRLRLARLVLVALEVLDYLLRLARLVLVALEDLDYLLRLRYYRRLTLIVVKL